MIYSIIFIKRAALNTKLISVIKPKEVFMSMDNKPVTAQADFGKGTITTTYENGKVETTHYPNVFMCPRVAIMEEALKEKAKLGASISSVTTTALQSAVSVRGLFLHV